MAKSSTTKLLQLGFIAVAVAVTAVLWGWISISLDARKTRDTLRKRWYEGGEFHDISEAPKQIQESILASTLLQKTNTFAWSNESDLAAKIFDMLESFRTGDWDRYEEFHFPVPTSELGGMRSARMSVIRRAYEETFGKSGLSDQEVFILWGKHLVSSEGSRNYGHAVWKAVDVRNIAISLMATNRVPVVHGFARTFEHLDSTSVFESIATFPPRDSSGYTTNTMTYAQVRIPVSMTRGTIGVYPIYAQFCWMPSKEKWIPIALGLPTTESELRIWF